MKNPPDGFEAQLSLAGRFSAFDELDRGGGARKSRITLFWARLMGKRTILSFLAAKNTQLVFATYRFYVEKGGDRWNRIR